MKPTYHLRPICLVRRAEKWCGGNVHTRTITHLLSATSITAFWHPLAITVWEEVSTSWIASRRCTRNCSRIGTTKRTNFRLRRSGRNGLSASTVHIGFVQNADINGAQHRITEPFEALHVLVGGGIVRPKSVDICFWPLGGQWKTLA